MVTKRSGFPRSDVRHHRIEDTARFQPMQNLGQKLARIVDVFEHVEAGDHIKAGGWKGSLHCVSDKYFRPGSGSRARRGGSFHLDSTKLPGAALHVAQKPPGATTDVQQRSACFVLANQFHLILPAAGRGTFSGSDDCPVVILRVMSSDCLWCWRIREPNRGTLRATSEAVHLCVQVKPVGRL